MKSIVKLAALAVVALAVLILSGVFDSIIASLIF